MGWKYGDLLILKCFASEVACLKKVVGRHLAQDLSTIVDLLFVLTGFTCTCGSGQFSVFKTNVLVLG